MIVSRNKTSTLWSFTKREMTALLAHASNSFDRSDLRALCFDSTSATAATTDGFRALAAECVTDQRGPRGPVAVFRDPLDRAVKIVEKDEVIDIFVPDIGKKIRGRVGGFKFDLQEVEGYPDIFRVFPEERERGKSDGASVMAFDPALLCDLLKFSGKRASVRVHIPKKELGPWLIVKDGESVKWRLTLMPMRYG